MIIFSLCLTTMERKQNKTFRIQFLSLQISHPLIPDLPYCCKQREQWIKYMRTKLDTGQQKTQNCDCWKGSDLFEPCKLIAFCLEVVSGLLCKKGSINQSTAVLSSWGETSESGMSETTRIWKAKCQRGRSQAEEKLWNLHRGRLYLDVTGSICCWIWSFAYMG